LHVAKLDVTVRAGDGAERAVAMGKDFQLVTGDTVITFDPETVGTVQYACWMNMQHGTIIIK
jgi:plastocyanin domain-containing protein